MRTVATDAKTHCCKKMAISYSVSSPRMWERTSIRCSTQSCERCRTDVDDESRPFDRPARSSDHDTTTVGRLDQMLLRMTCLLTSAELAGASQKYLLRQHHDEHEQRPQTESEEAAFGFGGGHVRWLGHCSILRLGKARWSFATPSSLK